MRTINIVNFYASDLNGISEGGIASYVREIIKQSDGRTAYSLVGVTRNSKNRIGEWGTGLFEKTKFGFFPALSVKEDHIVYKGGLPLNLRYLVKLFLYRSRIMERADSFHFHRVELALPFILFRRKGIPVIITIHGNNYDIKIAKKHGLFKHGLLRSVFHKLEKFIIQRADKVFFVSFEALKIYSDIYKKIKDKFIFLPTFVDMNFFEPLGKEASREENGLRRDDKILLFAGRLDEQKGLDLLLDAFILCLKESAGIFILLLIGDGAERRHLQERVEKEGIVNVRFYGNVSHSLLPRIMNCADVFVLTSLWEGMPIVLLEALACGIPVVSTDIGQVRQVVRDGVNGFVVSERDPALVKNAIFNTLGLGNDIQKRCRDSVADFSSTGIVDKIQSIHRLLIKK